MPVYLLPKEPVFPPVTEAEEDGLIAVGGDFSTDRLLNAYASGIFPWFIHDGEPYWFSPDPRMVLFPDDFRISGSLWRRVRTGRFGVKMDEDFEKVIMGCARVVRTHEPGTWISSEFIEAYTELHRKGFAHCVGCYSNGELTGGLYGVSIGKAFFGESMFHISTDASKVALYCLLCQLKRWEFHFVDCQVESHHFLRLGATLIPRSEYMGRLEKALRFPNQASKWTLEAGCQPTTP